MLVFVDMRAHTFANGEFYHIFNRGVEKRNIFLDKADFDRFLKGMKHFNAVEPVSSLWLLEKIPALGNRVAQSGKLVNVICYCLNPNHYHLILEQIKDGGVSSYMHRLSTGFAQYFNRKYRRSGVLFQGKFKSVPIVSNEQLLHVSTYVNLNDQVHGLHQGASVSSWHEYLEPKSTGLAVKDTILGQFSGIGEYKDFAESSLMDIRERKKQSKELKLMLFE